MVRSGVGRVIRQAEHLAQAGDLDEAHHGGRGMLDAQGTVLVTGATRQSRFNRSQWR